jgi:WD40 repeat protein
MKELISILKWLSLSIIIVFMVGSGKIDRTGEANSNTTANPADDEAKLVVQLGHAGLVMTAAISTDAKYVVTGGLDFTARLWEVSTGNQLRAFVGHSSFIMSIEISADNKCVVTGSTDGTARIWDMATGKQVLQFDDHPCPVDSVAFSVDGKYVASGGWDGTSLLWETKTGKVVQKFAGHKGWVSAIQVSADGKYVVTGSNDHTARVWEVATGKPVQEFAGHSASLMSVAISADNKYVATGSMDTTARIWKIATGKQVRQFKGHSGKVKAVAFLGNSKYVVSAGFDDSARIWDANTGEEKGKFEWQENSVISITVSRDGRYVILLGRNTTVRVCESLTANVMQRLRNYSDYISSVAISVNDKYIVTGDWKGIAQLWEIPTGKQIQQFVGHSDRVLSVALSADGKYLATASKDKSARLWEISTGKQIQKFEGHPKEVNSVAISTDGKYVVTGSNDKTARLWEAKTGKQVRKFEGHSKEVNSVAISGDGKYVATGSQDSTARLWEAKSGKQIQKLIGFSDRTVSGSAKDKGVTKSISESRPTESKSVVFSADDKYVLVGGSDGKIRLWEVSTGKQIREFAGHSSGVQSVAISANGKYIVASSLDNNVLLWDAETGRQIWEFVSHTGAVEAVAITADGKYVVTGGMDSTTRIWDTATGKELCSLVSLDDGNWITVTPGGYFDASNLEEIKGLHWVMSDEPMRTYPLEIFMRDFYEPRLLPRILNGETFENSRKLSELNRLQPSVKIANIERQNKSDMVTITVEVAQATSERQHDKDGHLLESGVYDLRLFRDGQIVGQYADSRPRALLLASDGQKNLLAWRKENAIYLDAGGKRIITFENIKLPHKANLKQIDFSAYAFNEDRVKSQTDRKSFDLPKDLTPDKGRAYVILFGVNACQAQCRSLDYAVNDVRKMQQTFVNKLKQSNQYQEIVDIPLIADYSSQPDSKGKRIITDQSATKANLKSVCDLLSGKSVNPSLLADIPNADKLIPATPQDLVLLFFSSHGDTDDLGNFYIVPYDIGQTALCDNTPISQQEYDQILARCISSEELSLWLRYVDAGEMMMIVDACHSAAAVENGEFKPGPMGSRGLGQLAYDKRMKILAATQGDNVAREFKELNQSLLSYVLTKEGIEEERADFKPADQVVMMTEWLQYGEAGVPKWYQEKLREKPYRSGTRTDKRLVQKNIRQQMQIPSLFNFTGKHQDLILFKRGNITKQ